MTRIPRMVRRAIALGALASLCALGTSAHARDNESSDAWITASAKVSLMTSTEAHALKVHVDTTEGRVTLHGKVTTEKERSAAERIVRALHGVKDVTNLLQVVTPGESKVVEKADDWIKDSAERALKEEHTLDDSRVFVKSVDKGVVLLAGKVASVGDHVRAVECIAAVPGVLSLVTEVVTDESAAKRKRLTRQGSNDDVITIATKLRLLADPLVPALEVRVDTYRGVVTLFGRVPSADARTAAEADARHVADVLEVRNELQVVPVSAEAAVRYTDGELQKKVRAALATHDELRGITATVSGGLVRLTGTVPTYWQSLRAATVVRAVPGVRAVDDSLRVPASARDI